VFAGPNGSGKSTIIKEILSTKVNENRKLDVGIYINADDIAQHLKNGKFSFKPYEVTANKDELLAFAVSQGLLYGGLSEEDFASTFTVSEKQLIISSNMHLDRLAQIIARFLRHALIKANKRFSFETVFSHESNLEDMRLAAEEGYKVYLYFVGTESPYINKYRVKLRVANGGHGVPDKSIEDRYYRSMDFLYAAAEIAYQTYFFDNSVDGSPYTVTGHFKMVGGQKEWDEVPNEQKALWFKKYYEKKMDGNPDGESPAV